LEGIFPSSSGFMYKKDYNPVIGSRNTWRWRHYIFPKHLELITQWSIIIRYSSYTIWNSLCSNHVIIFSMTQDANEGGGGECIYDHSVLCYRSFRKKKL
jgi:hypothetical protein